MPRGGTTAAMQHTRNNNRNRGPKSKSKNTKSSVAIKIRPYSKPPKLPDNYYAETSQTILNGALQSLQNRLDMDIMEQNPTMAATSMSTTTMTGSSGSSAGNNGNNAGDTSGNNCNWSLQLAYTNCVSLVSHKFGPQLYSDVLINMEQAAKLVLPDTSTNNTTNKNDVLSYLYHQYSLYTDYYLLLLKHICLPLDRWSMTQNSSSHTTTSGGNQNLTSLWQNGLHVFQERLQYLQLDRGMYQEWKRTLLLDWSGDSGTDHDMDGPAAEDYGRNQQLQHIWYLWQDLNLQFHEQLQHDLETYWHEQMQMKISDVDDFSWTHVVEFLFDKHRHVLKWRSWLPISWLWSILDHLLLENLETLFLQSKHFFPVLQLHLQQSQQSSSMTMMSASSTTTSSSSSPLVHFWILVGRIPNGQALTATAIQKFAKERGTLLITGSTTTNNNNVNNKGNKNNNNNNVMVIPDLLELQQQLNQLIATLMASGTTTTTTTSGGGSESATATAAATSSGISSTANTLIPLKSVWEQVVNVDTTPSIAEQLAKFLDSILRSNKKMDTYSTSSQDGGQDWLTKIIAGLFVPLSAKDVFEAFYKRDLAKRLLWNRVVSMDIEKQVCSLLKAECGAGYTSKMEGMFQDVDWSRETMLVYKQTSAATAATEPSTTTRTNSSSSNVDMEVQVLTTGYWPVYPQFPNLHLPDNLKEPQEQFANHYKTKYQGRRMTWQYALGHCVVKVNGFPKPYELLVSLCQALVLTQFETADTALTLPQIMQKIGLEDRSECERILQSLCMGKDGTRILRKHDWDADKRKKMRGTVDDRDIFKINSSFESNARRIRITNIMMKESKEERDKTVEGVSRDRLYLIDAVLVRIMKARKTILHQTLIPQVLEQIKVPAQPADVKKRIESLIEREYMERDQNDRNRYNYLA